jgi:hypothetical protein
MLPRIGVIALCGNDLMKSAICTITILASAHCGKDLLKKKKIFFSVRLAVSDS